MIVYADTNFFTHRQPPCSANVALSSTRCASNTLSASFSQPLYRLARSVTPSRRNMTAEDVGGAALYLMSDLGAAVNGQTLRMDGGLSALGITVPEGYDFDAVDDAPGDAPADLEA